MLLAYPYKYLKGSVIALNLIYSKGTENAQNQSSGMQFT